MATCHEGGALNWLVYGGLERLLHQVMMAAKKMEKNTRRNTEKYIDGPGLPARTEERSKRRWRQHARRRTSLLRFLNAPLHVRRVMMSSPLSKELKAQYDVSTCRLAGSTGLVGHLDGG